MSKKNYQQTDNPVHVSHEALICIILSVHNPIKCGNGQAYVP